MKSLFSRIVPVSLACAFAVVFASSALRAADPSPEEQRADIRTTSNATLEKLYTLQPTAKDAIAKAGGGYATFQNFGVKIVFIGGSGGKGLAHDNKTGTETFMKMAEAQVGLGLGAKKFSVIFVFDTPEALTNFVEKGWEFSGDATAAAKSETKGGAYSGAIALGSGVYMYQLTESGLMADLAVKGTKYYKDKDLN